MVVVIDVMLSINDIHYKKIQPQQKEVYQIVLKKKHQEQNLANEANVVVAMVVPMVRKVDHVSHKQQECVLHLQWLNLKW